jgi:hypothetical protein
MPLTRAMVLKALESALDARMEAEFRNLADPYSGTRSEKSAAQQTFIDGLTRTREAFEFAEGKINDIFPE